MGRLFIFLIIGLIALVIAGVKKAAGAVSGSQALKDTTFRGETKKVMDKTARGIGWMSEHWESAKKSKGNYLNDRNFLMYVANIAAFIGMQAKATPKGENISPEDKATWLNTLPKDNFVYGYLVSFVFIHMEASKWEYESSCRFAALTMILDQLYDNASKISVEIASLMAKKNQKFRDGSKLGVSDAVKCLEAIESGGDLSPEDAPFGLSRYIRAAKRPRYDS